MAAAGSGSSLLYESTDCSQWRAALDSYEEVVKLVTSQKKRGKGESLADLDNWFQKDLPASIASRDKPHLTHQELSKLMRWKLTRGKFRPRLTEMVQQNAPADVEATTSSAIAALPDLERAITTASKLKAVGPATASAILCAASPNVPFMADESAQAVPALGRLDYSLKQYMTYARAIQKRAKQLNEIDGKPWTAHEVELALWAFHHSSRSQPQVPTAGKRSRRPETETERAGQREPAAKKNKPSP